MSEPEDPRVSQRKQLLIGVHRKYKYEELGQALDKIIANEIRSSDNNSSPFTSDVPINSDDDVRFGFGQIAKELKNYISDKYLQMPFTMCIDGYWGSGKSSLARLIYDFLNEESFQDGCLPIWIDSSLISAPDATLSMFANQLHQKAYQVAQNIVQNKEDKLGLYITPLAPVTFMPEDTGEDDPEEESLKKLLKNHASAWLKKWDISSNQKWSFETFHSLIRETRSALLGGGGLSRIVWFIDDIDRCEANTIVRILQLHRTLLEEWGIILIYSMDYRIIEAVIGKHFLDQGSLYDPYFRREDWGRSRYQGRMYLEKFFSLRIRPPEPTDIKEWLISELGYDCYFEGLDNFVHLGFFNNPRYIKRFTNAVRFLKNRYRIVKPKARGTEWEGLINISQVDEDLALKILTKITAFALAENLTDYYELVRYPSPMRLQELELVAKSHTAYRVTRDTGEELVVPIPDELRILLSSGPSLEDFDLSVLESAILVIEPILPPPRIWSRRPSLDTQFLSTKQQEPKDGKAMTQVVTRPSITEKERAGTISLEWLSDLQRRIKIPTETYTDLRRTLIRTAPDSVVDIFRNADWEPKVMDLVQMGESLMLQAKLNDAYWTLCSACLHPNWSEDEMQRVGNFLESISFNTDSANTRVSNLLYFLYDVTSALYPDNDGLISAFARILVHSREKEKIRRGLDLSLRLLELTMDGLDRKEILLYNKFDKDEFISAFYWATDALLVLELNEQALRLCEAAIQTSSGVKEAGVLRSLGRALDYVQNKNARKVYYAAIALDGNETQACDWVTSVIDSSTEKLRCHMTRLAREPGQASHWNAVGVHIHNVGPREEATKWLSNALALELEDKGIRKNLYNHLQQTYSRKEAAIVVDKEYIPDFDKKLLDQANEAHKNFIRDILVAGKVEYELPEKKSSY